VKVMNGVSHPNDVGGPAQVFGVLKFEPTA